MWIENAEEESVAEALVTTLSGEEMCSLCLVVEAAKTDAEESPMLASGNGRDRPPLLPIEMGEVLVRAPVQPMNFPVETPLAPPVVQRTPPVPPPRAAI